MFRKIIKRFLEIVWKPILLYYLSKDRFYRYKGIRIKIKKGVFHPGFFHSSKFLWNRLSKENLNGKRLLELGAGSGLISFLASINHADVVASEISPEAISGLEENIKKSGFSNIKVIQSDLFENIPLMAFDHIIINPPYYPKNPDNYAEQAWYCGEDFEYFKKLFSTIGPWIQLKTQVWMVLSEDCDLEKISDIALENGLGLELLEERAIFLERNSIWLVLPTFHI